MPTTKRLIVGLGNPGSSYEATRHNVGFTVIDKLASQCRVNMKMRGRARACVGKGKWRGYPIVLAQPQSWMNLSGQAVSYLVRKLRLAANEIIVIVDDIHLPLGTLRLRPAGGAGGHNGLQNIIDMLGTSDFPRLRIGVGNEFSHGAQSQHVLSEFSPDEAELLQPALKEACEAVKAFVTDGLSVAMNRHNRRRRSI